MNDSIPPSPINLLSQVLYFKENPQSESSLKLDKLILAAAMKAYKFVKSDLTGISTCRNFLNMAVATAICKWWMVQIKCLILWQSMPILCY